MGRPEVLGGIYPFRRIGLKNDGFHTRKELNTPGGRDCGKLIRSLVSGLMKDGSLSPLPAIWTEHRPISSFFDVSAIFLDDFCKNVNDILTVAAIMRNMGV